MDISRANSEPFFVFHRTRESLDRTTKITTGALRDLQARAGEEGGADLVNAAVSASGEPWGNVFKLKATSQMIDGTLAHLSGLWVSHVFSAFHLFLDDVVGELSRYASVSGHPSPASERTTETGDIAIGSMYRAFGWDPSVLNTYLPLFTFFEAIRNCVVHRAGLASKSLVELRKDDSLVKGLEAFPRKRQVRALPSLPEIEERKPIDLFPRHSILASAVAYEIAKDVNLQLIKTLEVPGVVYMATHHAILADEHPARLIFHKLPEDAINTFLNNRYRVAPGQSHECIGVLRRLGQWERVRKRFKEVYEVSDATAPRKRPVRVHQQKKR